MVSVDDGPFIEIEIPDEDTGDVQRKFVSIPLLFGKIWEDYIRGMIPDEYTREMLREIGLSGTEVFHMMERLQGGKAEYNKSDYQEMSYI